MKREPGKLDEVELGLWIPGQVGEQLGLNHDHRAFAFRHRIEGRLWFLTPFWWRRNPDYRHAFLRQGFDAVRQIFPHLVSVLERADNGQLAVIVLQSGILQILVVHGDGFEQRFKLIRRIKGPQGCLPGERCQFLEQGRRISQDLRSAYDLICSVQPLDQESRFGFDRGEGQGC